MKLGNEETMENSTYFIGFLIPFILDDIFVKPITRNV